MPKLLIIEDDPAIRTTLLRAPRERGHAVAASAGPGLDIARRVAADFAVTTPPSGGSVVQLRLPS